MCAQRKLKSACVDNQPRIRAVWSELLLFALPKFPSYVRVIKLSILGYSKCAQWWFWLDCVNVQTFWIFAQRTYPKVLYLTLWLIFYLTLWLIFYLALWLIFYLTSWLIFYLTLWLILCAIRATNDLQCVYIDISLTHFCYIHEGMTYTSQVFVPMSRALDWMMAYSSICSRKLSPDYFGLWSGLSRTNLCF